MYVEEKESIRFACPFLLKKDYNGCKGRVCMAWRWKPELNPEWKPDNGMMMMTGAASDYRTKPPPYIDSKTHGYCGMAVRPNFGG